MVASNILGVRKQTGAGDGEVGSGPLTPQGSAPKISGKGVKILHFGVFQEMCWSSLDRTIEAVRCEFSQVQSRTTSMLWITEGQTPPLTLGVSCP